MNHFLNWRLPGFGLILGLALANLLLSFGPLGSFFGLAFSIVGIAIFLGGTPSKQPSSKLRAFSEWTLIGVVWIMIALITFAILNLH